MLTPELCAGFVADVLALRKLQQLSALTCDPVIRREAEAFALVVDGRAKDIAELVPLVPPTNLTYAKDGRTVVLDEARWKQISERLAQRTLQIAEREGGLQ